MYIFFARSGSYLIPWKYIGDWIANPMQTFHAATRCGPNRRKFLQIPSFSESEARLTLYRRNRAVGYILKRNILMCGLFITF